VSRTYGEIRHRVNPNPEQHQTEGQAGSGQNQAPPTGNCCGSFGDVFAEYRAEYRAISAATLALSQREARPTNELFKLFDNQITLKNKEAAQGLDDPTEQLLS
jgi:hypothetical protein